MALCFTHVNMSVCLHSFKKIIFNLYTRSGTMKERPSLSQTLPHFLVRRLFIFPWKRGHPMSYGHTLPIFLIIFQSLLIVAMHTQFMHCDCLCNKMFKTMFNQDFKITFQMPWFIRYLKLLSVIHCSLK